MQMPSPGSHTVPRGVTATTVALPTATPAIRQAQKDDPVQEIHSALLKSPQRPRDGKWRRPPLRRYGQLWPQLVLTEGIVCRRYSPGPTVKDITVPIILVSLRKDILRNCHDAPGSGHLGTDKTLGRVRTVGYWINVAEDVNTYCRECSACQAAKLPMPTRAPLTSMLVGWPWQMIAVDILEVPMPYRHIRYLLVIQTFHKVGRCYSVAESDCCHHHCRVGESLWYVWPTRHSTFAEILRVQSSSRRWMLLASKIPGPQRTTP